MCPEPLSPMKLACLIMRVMPENGEKMVNIISESCSDAYGDEVLRKNAATIAAFKD